ncbi:response regulator transcription factor [Pseudomonas sp. OV226]|jgi:two-component system capsular synthesis response regulator RcsB|uniref:response regulator transcription factor n=1 Tax=Pseudomonas sp. OV226 TaxID=2135588 RepID=UPI000D78DBEA|nr:response regulator transcription factor [Pseudomonas sp. OV226]PWK29715.1 LuxR family two component transcriptional regulator [Pseudomonas sp. OV226]
MSGYTLARSMAFTQSDYSMIKTKLQLVLADDHPAVLAGISYKLSSIPSLQVVGTASNSTEIVELLARIPCDILITDYAMPGGQFGDGISLLSFLRRRFPALCIIVFTMLDNPAVTREMSNLGVKAVLSKADDIAHLVAAIDAVGRGAIYFSPSALPSGTRSGLITDWFDGTNALTMREAEVVRLFVAGHTVKEIAEQLHRSKQTISAQKMSAMRKLGIERDADIFRFAQEFGFTSLTGTLPEAHPSVQKEADKE